jgi:hypothetical protein
VLSLPFALRTSHPIVVCFLGRRLRCLPLVIQVGCMIAFFCPSLIPVVVNYRNGWHLTKSRLADRILRRERRAFSAIMLACLHCLTVPKLSQTGRLVFTVTIMYLRECPNSCMASNFSGRWIPTTQITLHGERGSASSPPDRNFCQMLLIAFSAGCVVYF